MADISSFLDRGSSSLSAIQSQLPPKLQSAVNMTFQSVSLFALSNLLFPAQNIITFSSAGAPGDLAIFGTIAPPS
jgi:hypothetical protein